MKFAWLALIALAACTADVDVIATEPQGGPDLSQHALTNNERIAYQYFVNKGLTPVQSAAIVGNLMQESSVTPTSVQAGGPGRGIAQWSVGGRWDTSRGDNMTSFAAQRGVSRTNLTAQLDFIWFELTNFSGYGLASLRNATSITTAVHAFQADFEVCGACASSKRVQYAQQVLAAYGTSSGGADAPGAPTTTGCYSATLGQEMPANACVQSASDGQWYQCSNGSWIDRYSDPDPCNGEYPLN